MNYGSRAVRCAASAFALFAAMTSSIGHADVLTTNSQVEAEKPGSRYVQCDGYPNNMTAGESAARLLGAVTLLALFAPPPESADTSKRKFGADGVAVCTGLLEGETREGHPDRRMGLILARAAHHIEAKNYDAALADIAMARGEAEAAGLMADHYWARSRGRSFDQIEAAALFRQGKAAEAQAILLRQVPTLKHSAWEFATTRDFAFALPEASEAELQSLGWAVRSGYLLGKQANRLDEIGRFAESARLHDALIAYQQNLGLEVRPSLPIAHAALAHALAGNAAVAAERAAEARRNFEARKSAGKPEDNAAAFVEVMDLYGIVTTANGGDARTARRLFAARSEWVAASFGSVLEVNRRLRTGAPADDLIGGLARDPKQLWDARAEAARAEMLAKDSDNKTLFFLIDGIVPANVYEGMSKMVWRTDKSRLVIKPGKNKRSNDEVMALFGYTWPATMDAYAMHAALLARSRGHQGFVIMPIVTEKYVAASFKTGNRGDAGLPDAMFNDANEVIADMSALFPDEAALKARRAAKTAR